VFGDIFDEMFGGNRGRPGGGRADMRGQDLRFNLEITLEQAYGGTEATVRVPSSVACEACTAQRGARLQAAAMPDLPWPRPAAGPAGLLHGRARLPYLPWRGPGDRQAVPWLRRPGPSAARQDAQVTIPSGVEDGTRIRLTGRGRSRHAWRTGGRSLRVPVSAPPPAVRARGRRRHCRVPISMVQADLGRQHRGADARRQDGAHQHPAGAQGGHQFRMRGKGMPVVRSTQRGDMYIEINVETPTNLTAKQKELPEGVREGRQQDQPRGRGLLHQGEGDVRRMMSGFLTSTWQIALSSHPSRRHLGHLPDRRIQGATCVTHPRLARTREIDLTSLSILFGLFAALLVSDVWQKANAARAGSP